MIPQPHVMYPLVYVGYLVKIAAFYCLFETIFFAHSLFLKRIESGFTTGFVYCLYSKKFGINLENGKLSGAINVDDLQQRRFFGV